jgi:hypothetical protein
MGNTPKTRPTIASVDACIACIEDPVRRADCVQLGQLMQELTGAPPVMWGEGIVGFGSYTCRHPSGQALDWPASGFASRRNDLTVSLVAGFDRHADLLQRMGRHRTSKACLYLKRLSEVDMAVLRELVARPVAEVRALDRAAVAEQ